MEHAETDKNIYLEQRSGLDIVNRKPELGPFDELPEYWADGHKGLTMAQNIFSLVIPEGEMFFVRSVMRVKNKVKDPQLLEDIQNFAKQEAYHSKVHIEFNNTLRKHGYDVDGFSRGTKGLFKLLEKIMPAKFNLGVTAFLEHLTAMGAEGAFRYRELQEDWPKEAVEMWEWHAVEEMEHKSVAFDVLENIGGGYFWRIFSAIGFLSIATFFALFWIVPVSWYKNKFTDEARPGRTPSKVRLKDIEAKHPGVMKRMNGFMWNYFKDYFRPDFHPWEKDHSKYIEMWKAENPRLHAS
jgi:predicted metal-dependent hydrolase